MSISQLSISYLQEASAASRETQQSPCRSKTERCLGEAAGRSNGSRHQSASPHGRHLQRVALGQQAGELFEKSRDRDLLVSFTPKSSQDVISCKDVQKTTDRDGDPLTEKCLELTFSSEGKAIDGFLIGSIITCFGPNIIFIPLLKIHTGP